MIHINYGSFDKLWTDSLACQQARMDWSSAKIRKDFKNTWVQTRKCKEIIFYYLLFETPWQEGVKKAEKLFKINGDTKLRTPQKASLKKPSAIIILYSHFFGEKPESMIVSSSICIILIIILLVLLLFRYTVELF
jgi:hypothetical protein